MEKTFYIFRHGETDYNRKRLIQGALDIPLNDDGRSQAANIGKFLLDRNIGIIYSSRLERAHETSQIVARDIGVEVIVRDGLEEISWGDAGGVSLDEVRADRGEEFMRNWSSGNPCFDEMCFPGGEIKSDARSRMINALELIAEESEHRNIGIGTHSFMIRLLLGSGGVDIERNLKNCEIAVFKYSDRKFKLLERIRTDL